MRGRSPVELPWQYAPTLAHMRWKYGCCATPNQRLQATTAAGLGVDPILLFFLMDACTFFSALSV